jgi:hypothetical protein
MTIETLDKLHESGELRDLVRSGFISPQVVFWRKVYHCYQNEISKGVSKLQAIENVGEVFKVEQRTVYRILKRMK